MSTRTRILIWLVLLGSMSAAWGQTITVGPNLGTSPIGEVQLALTATGGTGTYSWALVSGTLPTGLALRTDVPAFFPSGTAAGLIGIATTPGTYSFTISVTSGAGPVTKACTMKITGFTLKDNYGLPDAFVGSAYSQTLTPLNNAGAVTFTSTGSMPAGMSLSSTGVLSGTPTTPGSYNIPFSMNDGVDTIFRGVGLNVFAVQITTPGLLPSATVGNSYSVSITASGGTPPYTFSSGGLPQGLSLNSSTGLLSGTVTGGQGRRTMSFTATDHNNNSYSKNMAIDILHPTVTAGYLQPYGNFDDCTIGLSCSIGVSVWNGSTDPFTYTVTGLPAGMDFRTGSGVTSSYISAGDLELWGTPTTAGTFNVQITVTDANSITTTESFPMHVSVLGVDGADRLPAGTRGTAYSKTLRVLGGTGPYTATLLPASLMPSGLSLSGLVVSGTPVENGFFNGELGFSDSASNSVHITSYFNINPTSNVNINNNSNLGTIIINSSYSNQFSACCVAAYTWNQIGGTLPPGMTFSTGGLFSGTPTTAGTYSFTVQAVDQANPAVFGVRVFNVVVTPLAPAGGCCTLPFGNVGTFYSQTLTLTGATGSVTFTLLPNNFLPPGFSLNGASGLLSGTPTQSGQFWFTLEATDSAGHTLIRSLNMYVFPAGQTPPVSITSGSNLGTLTIGEVQDSLNATGGNGTYVWSLAGGSLPPGLAIRTDIPSFFPAGTGAGLIGIATTPGTYNFTLSVSSGGTTASQTFTMKISGMTLKDVFSVPSGFIGAPYGYTLTPLGASGSVTWTATSALPPGLTLGSNGMISGTPTQAGTWTVNFNFTDGVDTIFRSFGITVFAVRFTTPGLLPNSTQGVAYNTSISAAGGTGSFTFSTSGGLPNGLSLAASGTISGTPNTGPGRYGFNVTATDTNHVAYTSTFSIDVIGVPPSLPSLDPINVNIIYRDATIGFSYARIVSVFNGGTAPFTWTATGLPPGMSIRPWDQAERVLTPDDAEIWGTPMALGTFNAQVTVQDANGATASLAFPFTVSALGVDGNDNLPNGTLGTPYSKTLRVLGGTGPYSVSLFNSLFQPLPAGLALSGMLVSGTPLVNGNFTPVLQFQDSAGNVLQDPASFTISGGVNSTITINQSFNLGTITTGSTYTFQLTACCTSSGQFSWSFVSGTLPPGITLSAGGLLTGTATTAGTYDFSVKAADPSNAGNFGQQAFELVVTPLKYTSNTTLPYGNVGSPYGFNLLTAITGAIGTPSISLEAGSYMPPGLAMSGGVISGTPSTSGRFGFTLIFTDTANNKLIRGFTLFIYPLGASPALQLVTLPPCRIMDTRNANSPLGGPFIAGATTRTIPVPSSACNVPGNAVAYSLNITVVPRTGTLGYLSVWPTGQPQPLVSTLNSIDGSVLANAAIVPAGTNGSINAYATNDTELIIDINGYFVPPTTGTLQFYPLTPCRILDTRNPAGALGGPSLAASGSRSFPIPSSGCGVPGGAAAYSLNMTVVPQGTLGYLTTWPTGQTQPVVSTLNSLDGTVLANAAIVPAGTNGAVSFFASDATDLIVDINGYFATPGSNGLNFYTATPCRIVDTRNPAGALGGPIMAAGTERTFPLTQGSCGLPPNAAAYSLNMTVVPSGFLGYLATWPAGASQPVVSTLNAYKGQVVANAAMVPAGTSGSINVYVTNTAQVIVDTNGFFGH